MSYVPLNEAKLEAMKVSFMDLLSAASKDKILIKRCDMLSLFGIEGCSDEELHYSDVDDILNDVNDVLACIDLCNEVGEWIFVYYESNGIFIRVNKPHQKKYGWEGMVLSGEVELFDSMHLPQRDSSAS